MATSEASIQSESGAMQSESGLKRYMRDHPVVSITGLTVVIFLLLAVLLYGAVLLSG